MDEAAVKRLIANRRGMERVREYCDENILPYPPELTAWLMDLLRYRNGN